jgi:hypothetical protein
MDSTDARVAAAKQRLAELKRAPVARHKAALEEGEASALAARNSGDAQALAALIPLREALREICEVEGEGLNARHTAEVETAAEELRRALSARDSRAEVIAQDVRQRETIVREIATQRQTVARLDNSPRSVERLHALEAELRALNERIDGHPVERHGEDG